MMKTSKPIYLSDFSDKRSNNLNFLKFVASLAVIISHAYPLSKGEETVDFLLQVSGQTLGLGGVAVAVFFVSSGFFVSKSIERKNDTIVYLKARLKRLLPPLWFMLIVVILICAVGFTTLSISDYFFNTQFLKYCLNFFLIPIHSLPSVFDSNVYPSVINGALWTLPIELICYVVLLVIYKLKLFNKNSYKIFSIIMVLGFIFVYCIPLPFIIFIRGYMAPFFMFYLGSLFWVYKDQIYISRKLYYISIFILIALTLAHFGHLALCLSFPYIVIYISFQLPQCGKMLSNLGNYSYGIYLFGWPIQQMVVSAFGGSMSIVLNCFISIPLACLAGILVYNVVEKRIA